MLDTRSEDSPASVAEFPSEPFPCPACGQLLAPTCRVCVACKHAIDLAEIARPPATALPAEHAPRPEPKPAPVRYPWRFFFVFIGISFLLALIFEALWGEQKAQLAMGGAQTLAGVWVFFDAVRQRAPRPLRWAFGSMLLPVVFFPWYWARRTRPQSPVPLLESEVGPVTRILIFALLAFFLASLILYIAKGPSPATAPASPPKEHHGSGGSVARLDHLRRWDGGRQRQIPGRGPQLLLAAASTHAETSAPSDASQT